MAKRRIPLEDKLVAATLLLAGVVMVVMTFALLAVIGAGIPAETERTVRPLLTFGVSLVMIATYVAIMIVLWLLVRWMVVRPVRRLLDATREVAAGRLDYRAEPMSTDEIGELAESFSQMTARLQESFESIEKLSAFNSLVLDTMNSGLIVVDGAGRVRVANIAACRIIGFQSIEINGRLISEIEPLEPMARIVERARIDRKPVERAELTIRPKDKDIVLGVSVSLMDDDGGSVIVFADLTKTRELERENRIRRELASLGELTAGIVHEIRSPLGVISATAQLLDRDSGADPNIRKNISAILDEVAQLESTVTDLLVFARPLDLELVEVGLDEVIERVATLCRPRIDGTHICFEIEPIDPAIRVRADRTRLAQAVANLVANSVDSLGDAGVIRIETVLLDENTVALRIADTGPGIPAEYREKLFEPFFTQKEGGTGLGLSIVHKLIAAHDGTIELLSTPTGATFQITLPRVR
ncbi:MAG: HAMP domain-containing protein [Candidatus Hydrogenedentes bacterium]|nr:HAMP domain-containing protein [Candidatus Hydrogenedentota bacterium]